jgi:hypothetical protein
VQANVPLLKQGNYTDPYGDCGTIASAGCGVTSLTMVLQYYGINVDVPTIKDMAVAMGARACPAKYSNVKGCPKCGGTRYTAFTNPENDDLKVKYATDAKNYTDAGLTFKFYSTILEQYGLWGNYINIGNKLQIVSYLQSGYPLIVSISGPRRFTRNGHFIVLTGCDSCIDAVNDQGNLTNKKVKIWVNDPYNDNSYIYTGELFKYIKSCFLIYEN